MRMVFGHNEPATINGASGERGKWAFIRLESRLIGLCAGGACLK
jgi:hypothetical protein